MVYITTAATTTIGKVYGIHIQVNTALTGTITVADAEGTKAIITNPTVGTRYEYYGFNGSVTVTPNATCDITVSPLNQGV